ncbi:MAG: hypothetical protein ACR2QK_06885, partial [Acidimicrobiales bacterium]
MIDREGVIERLQAGNHGLQISGQSRLHHVEAMASLLESDESGHGKTKVTPIGGRSVGILTAACAIALVLAVIGVANSGAAPDDLLYDAKRLAEQPVRVLDDDIVAGNRVEELEALAFKQADPADVLAARADARSALSTYPADSELRRAFELLAWPGPTSGFRSDSGVIMMDGPWNQHGGDQDQQYVATLPDGHLVTIGVEEGRIDIAATGPWTVTATAPGWQVANRSGTIVYQLRRDGDQLVIEPAMVGSSGAGQHEGGESLPATGSGATDHTELGTNSELALGGPPVDRWDGANPGPAGRSASSAGGGGRS